MKFIKFYGICVMWFISSQVWSKANEMACTGMKTVPGIAVETLSELSGNCKYGDAIVTGFPALYCDFKSTIVKGDGGSYYCIYIGKPRELRPFDFTKFEEKED